MPGCVISYSYPYRLESLANKRLHWAAKAKVVAAAREAARVRTLAATPPARRDASAHIGAGVLIIRQGPRRLDIDNCYSACKPVIDGIASVFGVDDGSDFWAWRCEQNKGPYLVSVVIRMTWAAKGGAA